ncbi:hypothetical protein FA95DRAFT_1551792, partial [Auriscalpium vulgare]
MFLYPACFILGCARGLLASYVLFGPFAKPHHPRWTPTFSTGTFIHLTICISHSHLHADMFVRSTSRRYTCL